MVRLFLICISSIFIFINCGETPKEEKQAETLQTDLPKVENKIDPSIFLESDTIGVFLAIAYFDENNNLEKVERFYNGKLVDY